TRAVAVRANSIFRISFRMWHARMIGHRRERVQRPMGAWVAGPCVTRCEKHLFGAGRALQGWANLSAENHLLAFAVTWRRPLGKTAKASQIRQGSEPADARETP